MADVAESPQEPSFGEGASEGEAAVRRVKRNSVWRIRDSHSQHEGGLLKRTGSSVIEKLREVTKQAQEWKKNEILLLKELGRVRSRNAQLQIVNGELFDKIAVQNEREKNLDHEIDFRKNTKTRLIKERKESIQERKEERKEFLQVISILKERVRVLEIEKELTLNRNNRRRKTNAVFLQARKKLINDNDAKEKTEAILLQERAEIINSFSKKSRALKKTEFQLLQERKKGKVKLRHRRDRTITILWDVTKKVLALTMDVEDSQPIGDKTRAPRSKSLMKMLRTLPSSWRQSKRVLCRAEAAFSEAAKNWVRDRDCLEAMKFSCREVLIERILGRKERPSEAQAALRDILDETTQFMERQPQIEPNILADVELKDSEKKKARRKQNNPQRLETRPTPPPQETEVGRKRKRIGISPPPPSEEIKVPRERRKPQRFGTSPPPPSKRMKVPRERKGPQRYGTIV